MRKGSGILWLDLLTIPIRMFALNALLALILLQKEVSLKPASEFEIVTNYQLKPKPGVESNTLVFEHKEDEKKETGTDLLPYLAIQIKVKRWKAGVEQIKIIDSNGKSHLKKKVNDEGIYDLDMGYVDDMKDHVTPSKFFILFLEGKKIVEQITIVIEEDGTFLVNSAKRGKF
jgi:hypothetical protein